MKIKIGRRCLLYFLIVVALVCESCSKQDPGVKAYNKGLKLIDQRRFEEALDMFDYAIQINPSFAHAYANRGLTVLMLRDDRKSALADFSKAIELNPELAYVYSNRGNVHADLGQLEEALSDQNKAIELDPRYINALNNRASLYLKLGEFENAKRDVERAQSLGGTVERKILEELEKVSRQ